MSLDLSSYLPEPDTLGDANQIANALQAIEDFVNDLPIPNIHDFPTDATKFLRGDGTWASPASLLPGQFIDSGSLTTPTACLPRDGSAVARSTYPDLLSAITVASSGVRTNTSPIITGLASTAGLKTGHAVEGTGIPSSTTILTVDSASQITLSANATSSGTSTVTVFPWGAGNGTSTFNVPDSRGRTGVGYAAASGHVDVSAAGNNEGSSLANRRPKHPHSHTLSLTGAPALGSLAVTGAPSAGSLAVTGPLAQGGFSGAKNNIVSNNAGDWNTNEGGGTPAITGAPGLGSLAVGGAPTVGSLAVGGGAVGVAGTANDAPAYLVHPTYIKT